MALSPDIDIIWQPSPDVSVLDGDRVKSVLLIGPRPTGLPGISAEMWAADLPPAELPTGTYLFRRSGTSWEVAAFPDGDGAPREGTIHELPENHPDIAALGWIDYLWKSARPVAPTGMPDPQFKVGDHVTLLGADQVWRVDDVRPMAAGFDYLISRDGTTKAASEAALRPATGRSADPLTWLSGPVGTADEFVRTMAVTKLTRALTDTLYSYRSTRTVFRPYQFRPVLRLLRSGSQRLLIADEVGLGKTIEAGLIWSELEHRTGINRGLVVCPSGLVRKWRSEMERRFDRPLDIVDNARLEELIELFERGDSRTFHGVVSLERLRSSSLLGRLQDARPHFDLVVVDEAHALRNQTTQAYALGELLSDWSDVLIFLSATPVNLGTDDLFNLMHLLAEEHFPDAATFAWQLEPARLLNEAAAKMHQHRDAPAALVPILDRATNTRLVRSLVSRPDFRAIQARAATNERLSDAELVEMRAGLLELNPLSSHFTRTRKVEVPDAKAKRHAIRVDVAWTAAEYDVYNTTLTWFRDRARALGKPVGFSSVMPLRQAASCLPAFRDSVLERSLGEDDDTDDPLADDVDDGAPETGDLGRELRDALRAMGEVDSKFDAFLRRLRHMGEFKREQAMVFSFFRRTLRYLEQRLRAHGYRVEVMDGSVAPDRRAQIMDRFRAGQIDLLLLSEVGSEGLDFEFCGALFNYDLPWNPMRVEQRIGRLDRFGQRHDRIYIFNFHVPGTIETDILGRLYDRIKIFEQSVGELEPILHDEVSALTRKILDPELGPEEQAAEATRIGKALYLRRRHLEDIKQSADMLGDVDQLMIDGLDRPLETGRFVGRAEILALVNWVLAETGSSIQPLRKGAALYALRAEPALADFVQQHIGSGGRTGAETGRLVRRLRDDAEIIVTFDSDEASRSSADLITGRHPLVVAALNFLVGSPADLTRFGGIRVNGSPVGNYLVLFGVLETTGLRPTAELHPIAIDLETGALVQGVGDLVLQALADGYVTDATPPETLDVDLLPIAVKALRSHARELQTSRGHLNDALVNAQIDAKRTSFDLKIRRAETTLAGVQQRAVSVQRIYEGRVRNLKVQRREAVEQLERRRGLAVTSEPVAVAYVEVIGPDYLSITGLL